MLPFTCIEKALLHCLLKGLLLCQLFWTSLLHHPLHLKAVLLSPLRVEGAEPHSVRLEPLLHCLLY